MLRAICAAGPGQVPLEASSVSMCEHYSMPRLDRSQCSRTTSRRTFEGHSEVELIPQLACRLSMRGHGRGHRVRAAVHSFIYVVYVMVVSQATSM